MDQPKRVTALEEKRIVRVACGGYHTLALTQEGELFGFGSNVSGECGVPDRKNLTRPVKIMIKRVRNAYDTLSRMMQEEEG